MKQVLILSCILTFAFCAHLNNSYLPPSPVKKASHGSFGALDTQSSEHFRSSAYAQSSSFSLAGGNNGQQFHSKTSNSYLPPKITTQANHGSLETLNKESSEQFRSAAHSASFSTGNGKHISIVKFAADNNGEGTYRYNYESANGITAEETGDARGDGTKAHGSYSFTLPNGEHVSVTYTADENGFVPQGSHIPTPPPIPEAILKALQENAAAEARGIFDDGQYKGEGLNEGEYHGEGENDGAYKGESEVNASSVKTADNGGYKY